MTLYIIITFIAILIGMAISVYAFGTGSKRKKIFQDIYFTVEEETYVDELTEEKPNMTFSHPWGASPAALIARGMFGIRPTGFKTFTLTPRLPKDWSFINLKNIHAFDTCFDVEVKRLDNGKLEVLITHGAKRKRHTIKEGGTLKIRL